MNAELFIIFIVSKKQYKYWLLSLKLFRDSELYFLVSLRPLLFSADIWPRHSHFFVASRFSFYDFFWKNRNKRPTVWTERWKLAMLFCIQTSVQSSGSSTCVDSSNSPLHSVKMDQSDGGGENTKNNSCEVRSFIDDWKKKFMQTSEEALLLPFVHKDIPIDNMRPSTSLPGVGQGEWPFSTRHYTDIVAMYTFVLDHFRGHCILIPNVLVKQDVL